MLAAVTVVTDENGDAAVATDVDAEAVVTAAVVYSFAHDQHPWISFAEVERCWPVRLAVGFHVLSSRLPFGSANHPDMPSYRVGSFSILPVFGRRSL